MTGPDYHILDLLERADHLEKSGEWLKAIQIYHRLLQEGEETTDVRLRLAGVYSEMGNYGAAERLLLAMLGSDHDNVDILYALGMVFFRAEQYDQAIFYLERIAGQSNPRIHYSLGYAHFKLERWLDAERHLMRALEIDPGIPRGFVLLAELYLHMRHGEDAVRAARIASQREPDDLSITLLLAHAHLAAEQWRPALDLFLSLHARSPFDPDPLLGASEAALHLREYERAILLLQEYLTLKPDDARIHARLGSVFVVKNQKDRARASFDRALELDPENQEALEHLHLFRHSP